MRIVGTRRSCYVVGVRQCHPAASGNLYVAESNGTVKHFTSDGKYLGMVGVADLQPGCKNSCVAATPDDSHLFYIDIKKSQIIVLAKQDASKPGTCQHV